MSKWPTHSLADLTKRRPICYGVLKPGERQSAGVPLIRVTDIRNDYLDRSNLYLISDDLSQDFKRSILKGNEVLLSIQGTVGRVAICPPDMAGANISRTIAVIDPDERLDRHFLRYWLLSQVGNFKVGGATRASFNIGDIRKLNVPVPEMEEQKRIVAILDEAFAGIATAVANTEKNVANARELFESYLDYEVSRLALGQDRKDLEALCAPATITYGVIKLGDEWTNGVACLRTSNVRRLYFDTSGMKRISPELSKEYSRTILKGGEVLVNVRGTLGGVAVAATDMSGWNVSREVAVVPVDQGKVVPEFAAYSIASRESQDWLVGVQKGVAYTGINLADLRELKIPVPSIDEQRRCVAKLDEMAWNCREIGIRFGHKLHALTELKQSLLKKAFSGELTATPQDKIETALA